ncbi:unnamed protein product [Prunus armeniaca]
MDDKELEMYRIFQAIDGAAVRRREGGGEHRGGAGLLGTEGGGVWIGGSHNEHIISLVGPTMNTSSVNV